MTDSTAPVIGILGGYGRVGAAAARTLAAEGGHRLRIGGRDATAAWSLARRLGGDTEAAVVDTADSQSVTHFSRGCATVLDCTGTAFALRGRVRREVAATGGHYVAMADDGAPRTPSGPCTAVLFTGPSATFAGWLPRRLGAGLAAAHRFTGWYDGPGTGPLDAAVTCLLGLRRAGHGPRAVDCPPPPAPWGPSWPLPARPGTVRRGLPEELQEQTYLLRLDTGAWYEAFHGTAVPAVLDAFAARSEWDDDGTLLAAAQQLVRAGRGTPRGSRGLTVCGTLDGLTAEGTAVRRGMLLGCTEPTALLGALAAVAVREVTAGRVPPGVHSLAATLPTEDTDWISRHLPRATVRMTEVLTGASEMMPSAPTAAPQPG
ncbi:hypothetical protein ACIHEJ_08030 [Streptomyces sp. NPDC052301]|uniref:hypothetical protein n=1 Tax=Streptomyces sp. NPDC052301 TaxID=3365687 RepID=UPI0037CF096B